VEALSRLNFRDIGGTRVRDGVVRRGMVYRSEGPASFRDVHHDELARLGFRVVCDLRSSHEQETAPNDWARGLKVLNFDIIADLRARNVAAWSALRADPTVNGARETMVNAYRSMPGALSPHLPQLVGALTANETPLLVHCTAGKDRTGVVIALLLGFLGAPTEEIHRDYLLSENFGRRRSGSSDLRKHYQKTLGYVPDEGIMQALIGVHTSYIDAALKIVHDKWGSIDNYFGAAGIGEPQRAALAEVLVEPDAAA
jgi:protein-tyrosine phosphatase